MEESTLFYGSHSTEERREKFALQIVTTMKEKTKRILIDLTENVLEELQRQGRKSFKSRKGYIEYFLTEHAQSLLKKRDKSLHIRQLKIK